MFHVKHLLNMFHMKQYAMCYYQSNMSLDTKEVGNLGETIACRYLEKEINLEEVARNYTNDIGEIDIVARGTDNIIHFIEVKTVSYETKEALDWAVTHETWRPEELVHHKKLAKIARVGEFWLQKHAKEDLAVQIDVVAVRLALDTKTATVNYIPHCE